MRASSRHILAALTASSLVTIGGTSVAEPLASGAGVWEPNGKSLAAPSLLAGDFNGDGRSDLALTGAKGWNTLPVAFSYGNGAFNVTNDPIAGLATWATAGATPVVGDFNGDGKADIALTGGGVGVAWTTIPVAFSNGDGTFNVTNLVAHDFALWANEPNIRALAGDFNGDGKADIALVGGADWNTQPIAFSNGDGTFRVTNDALATFPAYAAQMAQGAVAGDFNGDGKADIALTGQYLSTVPVAFSHGDGTFQVTNNGLASFQGWAAAPGAEALAGDFNGDGKADIALTGGTGWSTVPIAYSTGGGGFTVDNMPVASFPGFAASAGAQAVSGDFDGDGRSDIALAGGVGWTSVPLAFSSGGAFSVTNDYVPFFPAYASQGAGTENGNWMVITPIQQEHSHWCWDAAATMVMTYLKSRNYSLPTPLSQCAALVRRQEKTEGWGTDKAVVDCCATPFPPACDHTGFTGDILTDSGYKFDNAGTPSFATLASQMAASSPAILSLTWNDGSGQHSEVINGALTDPSGGQWVEVIDPGAGEQEIMTYAVFSNTDSTRYAFTNDGQTQNITYVGGGR
jgi:hypothetical protein